MFHSEKCQGMLSLVIQKILITSRLMSLVNLNTAIMILVISDEDNQRDREQPTRVLSQKVTNNCLNNLSADHSDPWKVVPR